MTISRLSCPKTSAPSAVNTSPQFRPGVLGVPFDGPPTGQLAGASPCSRRLADSREKMGVMGYERV